MIPASSCSLLVVLRGVSASASLPVGDVGVTSTSSGSMRGGLCNSIAQYYMCDLGVR